MIQNVWALLCKRIIVDKRSGNVSIIEAVSRLEISLPPEFTEPFNVLIGFEVASFWENSDSENDAHATLRFSLIDCRGKESLQENLEVEVKAGSSTQWFINIKTLQIVGPGRYFIVFRIRNKGEKRWKRAASLPLNVVYDVREDALVQAFQVAPPKEQAD